MGRKIRKLIQLSFFWIYNRICSVFFRLKKNKVVFLSEAHEALNGNLKAVYEYIKNDGYEICVHVKPDRRNKTGFMEAFKIMYDMTTSKYIFLDDFYGLTSAMRVRKNQRLIQLWHGSGAYKKFGYSRTETGDQIKSIHSGYKKYTDVFVSSEEIRVCYADAFGIDIGKVKALGNPRTDLFFDEKEKKKIRDDFYLKYSDLTDKKIVLIAPTYRGRKVEDAGYDFDVLNLESLQKELGAEYQIIVKWHPALVNNLRNGRVKYSLPKGVMDFSDYKDINELMLIADVLVTDYSSVIFDYCLTGKPIVYFAYDLEKYKNERGLYFPFEDYTYGEIVVKSEDLRDSIKRENHMKKNRYNFKNKFMSSCEGNSTPKICGYIFKETTNDK